MAELTGRKKTISSTVLDSSFTSTEFSLLCHSAEERINNHPLYGFYRDDSEEMQEKIEKGFAQKRRKKHVVEHYHGGICRVKCVWCPEGAEKILLRRSAGKMHLNIGNFTRHCYRYHFGRNSADMEVIFSNCFTFACIIIYLFILSHYQVVGTKGADLEQRNDALKRKIGLKLRRPELTIARSRPGRLSRSGNMKKGSKGGMQGKTNLEINSEANSVRLIQTNYELNQVLGNEYSGQWADPSEEESGWDAVRLARVHAKKTLMTLDEYLGIEDDEVFCSSTRCDFCVFSIQFFFSYEISNLNSL